MHYFITMRHGTEDYLAATSEQIAIHVDLATRKTCPWPDDMKATFAALSLATSPRSVANRRGKKVADLMGPRKDGAAEPAPEAAANV